MQLVSHDEHAGTYNYKFTFSVKLVPICKEDLCLLPHKVHHGLGGMGPVVLCTHVSSAVHLLDPFTLRQVCPPLHFLHTAPGVLSPTGARAACSMSCWHASRSDGRPVR